MTNETISRFSQLALAAPVLQAIEDVGYESPSPIQAESIPPLLEGRDLLGQAQTGTGKTAAFCLPLLSQLDLSQTYPQALVLTPTRELALQVAEAMQTYARHLEGFHVLPLYGGQGMDTQLRRLRRGVHAVVGTPGRILDHLRRKTLKLEGLSMVVLDEADEMLRMGFIDDVELILSHTPTEKQVALFSATMPAAVKRVAQQHLRSPVEIRIKNKTATVSTITQRYWQVTRESNKLEALTRILEVEDFEAMLVFVRTKVATMELAEKLEARGYSCAVLNGDINQNLREKTVERLKSGSLDIVVATDVAARGLDVDRISHVVNYDVPYDTETYVHRIGRTGRAGRKGDAILFISGRERRMLNAIEKATRQPIEPMQLPSQADIADRRIAQFKQRITETIESEELFFFEELIRSYQREQDLGLHEIAGALAFLVQQERPLAPSGDEPPIAAPVMNSSWVANTPQAAEAGMQCFRLEVGREHGVLPKHIVGAIANETGLTNRHIGKIQLFDTFSTVTLPDGMPQDVLSHLQQVQVCGQRLRLRPWNDANISQDARGKGSKSKKSHKPVGKRARKEGNRKASADRV